MKKRNYILIQPILFAYLPVMTVKNPLDALATLRTQKGLIDLVVTDFHMPYMNGFQLQEQIDKEFQLPVISKYYYI
ncbi:hypothetical protein F8388_005663 [Cannabis sativa]|uniref:Response regulatory domain-containing protein n=1 Tax=Cannabis sativa TaxID=3483 RepID=A0A7J6EM52_CANSA|nr:hypothetical protein F8388_005663 [Cannabis sativa]